MPEGTADYDMVMQAMKWDTLLPKLRRKLRAALHPVIQSDELKSLPGEVRRRWPRESQGTSNGARVQPSCCGELYRLSRADAEPRSHHYGLEVFSVLYDIYIVRELVFDQDICSTTSALAFVNSLFTQNLARQVLPVPMQSRSDFSLWSVLKNCVGKELSKITMPVIFNEPLSFLQRMVEYMEYAQLLRKASEEPDPNKRMQLVAAFAVSALASNWERLGKPFNPLLGETYELEREEFRVVCEQVSHHPPVSAFHADSPHFTFHGSIHPKLKFWVIQPKGMVTVELTRAILTFKPAGWFSKDLHRVEGFLIDKYKKKLNFLYGKWTEFIRCTDVISYEEYMRKNVHKFR
uniref:Oxysterol-binding protein n=1 Tax=Timema genevievae TaxID=629358 RepID=A0A7R9JR85_TIMGE|nr:unnamed protein product [Timema genevievae]